MISMGAAAAMAVKKVEPVKPVDPRVVTQEQDIECFLITLPPRLVARAIQILRGLNE